MADEHLLPGGLHPSGLVVVAIIFLGAYWFVGHAPKPSGTQSTHGEDIGAGGGIKPLGWFGEAFVADEVPHEEHFRRVMIGREPAYHQPVVTQSGKRTPFYRFIDSYSFKLRAPFLQKRSFPG